LPVSPVTVPLKVSDPSVPKVTLGDERFKVVVVAPGAAYFRQFPEWASVLPEGIGTHTCDLVRFQELSGARVLVIGGRQSAYEWAALLGENGAERVDVVHRHDLPRFERVSWKFVDPYIDATLSRRGWWRSLSDTEQGEIAQKFWQVGRLSLEWWLTPRLVDKRIRSWPGTHVVETAVGDGDTVAVALSSGERLTFDRLVFATGYKVDLPRVPYLNGLAGGIEMVDGFPVLDEAFQSSISGLYITGFASTRDFGPFFGFTKGYVMYFSAKNNTAHFGRLVGNKGEWKPSKHNSRDINWFGTPPPDLTF